jgi:decaprenylphospho-beta-D-erythro-pentofuranosid-2-ulose 2-reductase
MAVLILGATSPIARAVGDEFAARGHALCLAARDVDEARRIASDLEIRHGVLAKALAFDARDFDSHPALIDEAQRLVGPLDVALVAFGAMGDQESSQQDFRKARQVIDVNYTGAASLCEAIADKMTHTGNGTIIGITSVAGDRGRASNYIYGSAKGAFTLYLQGLRNRLAHEGVHVLTVKLGFVDTRMTFAMDTSIPVATPEATAAAIVDAADQASDVIYYPHFWRGIMAVIKSIPERVFKHLSL